MTIDLDGNQIIDESAISVAEIMDKLDKWISRALNAEREVELINQRLFNLNIELNKKTDIINQWQVDDYFRVNYPNQH